MCRDLLEWVQEEEYVLCSWRGGIGVYVEDRLENNEEERWNELKRLERALERSRYPKCIERIEDRG
jgi:hypothetical protein